MKKSTTRITVIIALIIIILLGGYAYLANRRDAQRAKADLTAVQTALSKDLKKDYPPTPREVIKYYNELLQCFYNEDCSDEEIAALGNKARELYDQELLDYNEPEVYLLHLQADIADYKEHGRRIISISLASSTNVERFEEDGFSFARIMCNYNIQENGTNYPTPLIYLLRQDGNKQWKIYGWKEAGELEDTEK